MRRWPPTSQPGPQAETRRDRGLGLTGEMDPPLRAPRRPSRTGTPHRRAARPRPGEGYRPWFARGSGWGSGRGSARGLGVG